MAKSGEKWRKVGKSSEKLGKVANSGTKMAKWLYVAVLFCWVPSHVGIQGNELADAAAKAALNQTLTIMTLPYSDFKHLVKRFIRGKWSDFWATQINNKLYSVQPTLGCGSLSNRDRRRTIMYLVSRLH